MSATPTDAVRPFAILAVAAFVVGFVGFMALDGRSLTPPPADPPAAVAEPTPDAAAVTVTPAADDWNLPKKI